MNKLLRTGAVVALSLTLSISALAGTLHSPGVVAPPPPPSNDANVTGNVTGQTNTFDVYQSGDAATGVTTKLILTIFSLLP